MQVRGLSQYPNWLTEMFLTGNNDMVAVAYRFPATLYFADNIYLLSDASDLSRVLTVFRATLLRHKIKKSHVTVVNQPEWTARKFKVEVTQTFEFKDKDTTLESDLHFFVERQKLRPAIRMVDVKRLPFSDEMSQNIHLEGLRVG